ncbi:MAG: polysaccharide biosynthesis C-terminal domain-containing protein [Clostridia bacterium]|nr:polysaccharide biosynthesis C-terminal domain-containing protein [Clostridia bacterium]
MPLYTSILSAAEFGEADIISQTANLLIPLAALGICDGIFRFALESAKNEKGKDVVFSTGITVLSVGSICLILLVQLLRLISFFDGYVMLIAAYVICANFHSAAANYLRAKGKNKLFALQGILNTSLTIVYNMIFLVVFHMGVLGYVLSVVIADLTVTLFLVLGARLWRCYSPKAFDRQKAAEMLRFSIPFIPTTMMWLITSASDRYIVSAYAGTAENGLYAVAYKIPTLITLVCTVFIEAWQFSTVRDSGKEDRSEFFGNVYKYFVGIIFMGSSLLVATSKIFTRLLLDESYYSSWQYVPPLTVALVFSSLVAFLGSVYFVEKKSVMSMLTAMAGALVNVVLNFVLIPDHGAMGAAMATVISYMAVYAIRAYDTREYLKFDMNTLKVIVNTILLSAQALLMIRSPNRWYLYQAAFLLLMFIINGKNIVSLLVSIIKNFKKSKKN